MESLPDFKCMLNQRKKEDAALIALAEVMKEHHLSFYAKTDDKGNVELRINYCYEDNFDRFAEYDEEPNPIYIKEAFNYAIVMPVQLVSER
jgi:hypothetical protein